MLNQIKFTMMIKWGERVPIILSWLYILDIIGMFKEYTAYNTAKIIQCVTVLSKQVKPNQQSSKLQKYWHTLK